MFPTFFPDMVEGYLEALAFAESPERYQVSGAFDVARFYFSVPTRKRAAEHVRTFWHAARAHGINLTEWDARELGHCIAYDRNCHGTGFDDMAEMLQGTRDTLRSIASRMGYTETEFRTRGNAIHMRLYK